MDIEDTLGVLGVIEPVCAMLFQDLPTRPLEPKDFRLLALAISHYEKVEDVGRYRFPLPLKSVPFRRAFTIL